MLEYIVQKRGEQGQNCGANTHNHGLERDLFVVVDGLLLVGRVGVAKARDVHQVTEVQCQGDGQQPRGGLLGNREPQPSGSCTGTGCAPSGGAGGPAIPTPYLLDLPWLLHGEVEQFSSSYFHVVGIEDAHLLWVSIPDQRGLFPKAFPNLPEARCPQAWGDVTVGAWSSQGGVGSSSPPHSPSSCR